MGDIAEQVLVHMEELPIEIKKNIFHRYVKSTKCCIGIEITRNLPSGKQIDHMVPNTFLTWEIYVDGQPEFRHEAPPGYFMENIKWAKDNLHNGSISIGRNILFI